MIDLRSDTVTRPTPAMLEAMMRAPLGDDVFGDDPSVQHLEEKAADLFGKEAGLFCPSGTMANQIAIKVHTQPGNEVICDQTAHIYNYEGGGVAFNSGCSVRLIAGDRGRFNAEQVRTTLNPDDIHYPLSRLVVIENTSNKGGGSCWDLQEIKAIEGICSKHGLALHLDGARVFNAMRATGLMARDLGRPFHTISLCLSKGLGAPVGSVLLGSREHIRAARRVRKVLGGGMRQAGILAAAGTYALDHHVERLDDDHRRAMKLARALEAHPCVDSVLPPQTNILIFNLRETTSPESFLEALRKQGILAVGFGPRAIRFVTHLDVDDAMAEKVCQVLGHIS